MADNKQSSADFLAQISSFGDQMKSMFKDVYDAADDLKKKIGTDLFDPSDAKEYLNALEELQKEMEQFSGSISGVLAAHIVKDFNGMINTVTKMFSVMSEDIEAAVHIDKVVQTFKKPFESIFDTFTDSVKNMPAVGQLLYDHLNVPKIREQLESNLSSAFANVGADGKVSLGDLAAATTATFKSMASVVGRIAKTIFLNPWLLTIAAIVYLTKKFIDLENEAEDFRKTIGGSYYGAKQLTIEIENNALSARRFGVTMEDAFHSAEALVEEFGNAKIITGKAAVDLATLSKTTGITEANAAGVYRQFLATSGATSQTAVDMSNTLAYVSQLMGVPMDEMFSDIAGSGEFIATYIGKSADGIIKAAAQARLLGLNMKDVADITSSIMDFEGSIERELMASILVGKQINFNRARYLAFKGDVAGATDEVMRQVGSLEEFNKLNPIAAKSLADAAGLTVEQLRNSLQTQDLINSATGQYKKDLQKASDIIAGRTKLTGEDLKEQQRAAIINQGAMTEMKNSWAQIGASLAKTVLPAMQAVSVLLKGAADFVMMIFGAIDSLTGSTDGWGSKLAKVLISIVAILAGVIAIKYAMAGISKLTGLITKLPGLGGGAVSGAGGGGFLGKIFGGMNPAAMIKGAAAILIISGALWVFAKALQEMKDVKPETLITAIVGLGALAGTAILLASASWAMVLGAGAMILVAGALYVFGTAAQLFIPLIAQITDSIVSLGSINATNLLGVALAIGMLGTAIMSFGATSAIGGFFGLFGGGPIDDIERLSKLGPGLKDAAVGLAGVNAAMKGEAVTIPTVTPEAVNLPVNASTTLTDTITNGDNLIIEKLNQLIDAVNNQDIYLDGRKVNTNLGRNAYTNKIG